MPYVNNTADLQVRKRAVPAPVAEVKKAKGQS
jgi:hypothetical protein